MADKQVAGISIADYPAGKADGSISLQRLGPDSFQLLQKNFDQRTGKEMAPLVAPCNLEGVKAGVPEAKKEIAEKQAQLAALEQLLADMEALEAAAKVA